MSLPKLKNILNRLTNVESGKLDKMVVSKNLNTAGWYRVAKYKNDGGNAKSFIMNIDTRYGNGGHISAILGINIVLNKAKITNISSNSTGTITVNNVRITKENNEHYIEIYYSINLDNIVRINILNQDIAETMIEMLGFEAPTDTATVLDEISIGEFTTGVEYATNEFLDGKRIYKKRINFGALPNSTDRSVVHGISESFNLIDMESVFNNNGVRIVFGSNGLNPSSGFSAPILGYVSNYHILMSTQHDASAYTGYVTLYYTKN